MGRWIRQLRLRQTRRRRAESCADLWGGQLHATADDQARGRPGQLLPLQLRAEPGGTGMTDDPQPRHLDYDGRLFRSVAPETSYGSDGPTGHYHQLRDLVWAEFAGGKVRIGRLVGQCSPDGTLSAGYVQVL